VEEEKIKVDTRIDKCDYEKVLKIASEKYDGNKSLALRMIIKQGIEPSVTPLSPITACDHDFVPFFDLLGNRTGHTQCKKCNFIP
jgi:hypothetical protein